jgi:DNA repair exonuclease SbcCD ATPase subunit
MAQSLKLKQLTLVGFRKNYTVKFREGLNYISGPMSTGKSTIMEMISYALGSKKHKDYIEVKASCTDVELEIWLKGVLYKISRPLFNFEKQIRVYKWDENANKYNDEFEILEVDSPTQPNSLSRFLLEKLDIPEITLSNQAFSFRDLFKYSYVSQSKIDSENLLDEQNYSVAFKRKPTLELIFNSLDQLLQSLKESKKLKKEEIDRYYEKKQAIISFLRNVNLFGKISEYNDQWKLTTERISERQAEVNSIKDQSKFKDEKTRSLEAKIFLIKRDLSKSENGHEELRHYLEKLSLLRNQYQIEIVKLDYLILANGKLQKIEFIRCPVCLGEVHKKETDKCYLCGNDLTELSEEEEKAIKLERKRVDSKLSQLIEYIEQKGYELQDFDKKIKNKNEELLLINEKINEIQKVYISPFIARIEELNQEIGELKEHLKKINQNVKVQNELEQIADEITSEELKLEKLSEEILKLEGENEGADKIIMELSKAFEKTLASFGFPKLTNAYVDKSTYIPYVRGARYNDLGSLGAVTLITVAYFLSILKIAVQLKKTYHLGLLMLDSISSNLGHDQNSSEDEFKDDKILKLMIKHLVDFAEKNEPRLQLIVINNGHTADVKKEQLILEFDGDGSKDLPYGLIDDMTK